MQKLEVFRMGVYVLVPVATFYWFNHPAYYEKYIEPFLVRCCV